MEALDDDPNGSQRRRGAILLAFRRASGLQQKSVERRDGLSDAVLSSWERGDRGTSAARVAGLADLYGAPIAMPGLWAAVGTVDGLPPRSDWAMNFTDPGSECWVWIRAAREAVADLNWGVALHGRVHVPAGRGGVIVRFPTFVHNPPLEVSLTAPGWVDSGHGVVPPAVAHTVADRVVEAATLHDGGLDHDPETLPGPGGEALRDAPHLGRALSALAAEVDIRWDLVAPYLPRVMLPARDHVLDPADLPATSLPGVPETDVAGLTRCLLMRPDQIRRLREARGLARDEAAAAANALGDGGLSKTTLERLEREGRMPTVPTSLARLDTVLKADGRLGLERTFDSGDPSRSTEQRWTVALPAWWVGPVWLQASAPEGRSDTATMRLRWGPWRRSAGVAGGTVLTTRKAPPGPGGQSDLTVELPPGWRLSAGTGAVSNARDIGQDWKPVNVRAAWLILNDTVAAMQMAGTTRLRFKRRFR